MDAELLSPSEVLALKLHEIGAVQFGKFELASGKITNVYLDLRILVSFPVVLAEVAAVYHHFVDRLGLKFDLLTAPPMAGLPIGTALSLEMKIPLIYPRKTIKNYGMGKGIEGAWSLGQNVLVIDDVITSGGSIIETISTVKAAGLQVSDAVVFIDREQGGKEILAEEGYKLHAVMTLRYLLSILQENDRISQKQYTKAIRSLF
jgi:orotate phosphoribosyltransferase